MVLPSPVDPIRMARLHEDAYEKVVRRLQDLVGVVLMDCGTGLHEATSKAALKTADQVVLVTDAEPATASIVAEAAALLRQEGVPLYLLVNKMPSAGSRLDVGALEVDETRGFMKAVVDADTSQVLGCAILGLEGGEIMSALEIAMMGKVPYTVLRDGVFAHPTLMESLNNLFSSFE